MPGTRSAAPEDAACFPGPDALPPEGAALLDAAGGTELFLGRPWWRTVLAHGLPPGAAPRFVLCRAAGRTVAVVPLLAQPGEDAASLATPYTCLWQPATAAEADAAALRHAGRALARACARHPVLRLDALDAGWPGLAPFLNGLRRAGRVVLRFDHFGNWHEPVAGRSFEEYLAARPGSLRETVRRKLRRVAREAEFVLVRGGDGLEAAIAEYEAVYARSWKEPEPFPGFNPAWIRATATLGALRLGLLRAGGRAVAAQFWTLHAGRATVLKLAHDDTARGLSPGTVLTALVLRELLGREEVTEVDFGRGDDPYKQLWTTRRRQRIGVLAVNPRAARGLAVLGRHALGRGLARLRGLAPSRIRE